jgi:hypothetical protein
MDVANQLTYEILLNSNSREEARSVLQLESPSESSSEEPLKLSPQAFVVVGAIA